MLLVQGYLKTHTFGDLAREHGVYASFSKSGHKFSLNYDQIEAKEADPLAQECRGLVLAREDGASMHPFPEGSRGPHEDYSPGATTILAYPMKRFFNHGQGSAAQINWSDPELAILEKLDGTLCIVYYDWFTKQWCVATRSVPEADLPMDNGLFTFRTLFEKALKETVGDKQYWIDFDYFCRGNLSQNFTYCFELTTPYNRIVVNYPDSRVTLLAARHMPNLMELPLDHPRYIAPLTGLVPTVQAHTYTSVEELVNWVSSLNPLEHEGVVVRDSNFNRIKVKNAAYVAYNKLHDRLGSSERNCMEFVLLEKDDDVAQFLGPEIAGNMAQLKVGLQKVLAKYDSVYHLTQMNLKALGLEGNKKEFAIRISTLHKDMWHAPFFAMFDGKVANMKDFIIKNKKDGSWGDSFLDKILEMSRSFSD